jgi:DNA mismatch repair ATPase MutS
MPPTGYLLTLIRKAISRRDREQMEDPAEAKKRGSKSVVKRDVVRLVTPGTLTEDSLLEARRHNFLCAVAEVRDDCALAWADISTGEFRVLACPVARLGPEFARLAPREVLVSDQRERDLARSAASCLCCALRSRKRRAAPFRSMRRPGATLRSPPPCRAGVRGRCCRRSIGR